MDWQPDDAVACLKSSPGRAVWRVERPDGSLWVVKRWAWKPLLRLKWMMRQAAPQREARGNGRLVRAGVPCPGLAQVVSYQLFAELSLPYVPGETLWELMKRQAVTTEHAAAVGRLVASLARAGLYRRDLKPDNLVITPAGGVVPIDNDGVHRCGHRAAAVGRMVAKLEQVPREFGVPVPQAFWQALRRHADDGEP